MNGQKENLRKKGRRLLTAFLALALAMTYFPADMLTAQAEETAAQTEAAARSRIGMVRFIGILLCSMFLLLYTKKKAFKIENIII